MPEVLIGLALNCLRRSHVLGNLQQTNELCVIGNSEKLHKDANLHKLPIYWPASERSNLEQISISEANSSWYAVALYSFKVRTSHVPRFTNQSSFDVYDLGGDGHVFEGDEVAKIPVLLSMVVHPFTLITHAVMCIQCLAF